MFNKQSWVNEATNNLWLRFPKVSLKVIPADNWNPGVIKLYTYIRDTKSDYITRVESVGQLSRDFDFDFLNSFKKEFDRCCKEVEETFNFTAENSIKEPSILKR